MHYGASILLASAPGIVAYIYICTGFDFSERMAAGLLRFERCAVVVWKPRQFLKLLRMKAKIIGARSFWPLACPHGKTSAARKKLSKLRDDCFAMICLSSRVVLK
jgi:hypothetical protein